MARTDMTRQRVIAGSVKAGITSAAVAATIAGWVAFGASAPTDTAAQQPAASDPPAGVGAGEAPAPTAQPSAGAELPRWQGRRHREWGDGGAGGGSQAAPGASQAQPRAMPPVASTRSSR